MGASTNRCYVKAYYDWVEQMAALEDDERGRLFVAILEYARSGAPPEMSGREAILFPVFKAVVDRDAQKSDAMARNGATGGRASKANASKFKQTEANESKAKPTNNIRHKTEDKEHKTEDDIPPKSPSEGDAFERFWSVYPRKIGKQSAKRAFERVKVPLETLVTAVERQKCSDQWTRDNGQYIPHPTTWLNQGRWDDDLPKNEYSRRGQFANGDVFAEMLEEEKNRGKS